MARPSNDEQLSRGIVDRIREGLDVSTAPGVDVIRREALALFTRELDGKLRNLQDGETLQITYRVDIVGQNDRVRGGVGSQRTMPEYRQWRDAVYERDAYTCQDCGAKGSMNAHHIESWATHPDLRFDVANGVTLCVACHKGRHPHLRIFDGKA